MPPLDPAELVEALRLRSRLRRAREARGLPVEPARQLSDDEQRDLDRAAEYAGLLIDRLEARSLSGRLHRLRRGRARPVALEPVPQGPVVPVVDETGAEVRRALPAAPRCEPEPVDTASSVRSMVEAARRVQDRIGGRRPREGGAKHGTG